MELGFDVPKTTEDTEVSEDIQVEANRTFEVFAAYKRAGFTYDEALELVKAHVGGRARVEV